MSYGQPLPARRMNRSVVNPLVINDVEEQQMNGVSGHSQPIGIRSIDPDQLKSRLYSYAPQQAAASTKSLKFNRITRAQMRKSSAAVAAKLEPVVSFKLLEISPEY